jgi:hypothetical protein
MGRTNPHQNSKVDAQKETAYTYLTTGRVTTALDTQKDGLHHVIVQESAAPNDEAIPVLTQAHGDYYVPPEQMPVVVAPRGKNDYSVVASAVPNVQTPDLDPGERIISHPLSEAKVKFNADGTLDIVGDATVRINGGDQGAITDVQAGGTNSNGGITSLDITRNPDILI